MNEEKHSVYSNFERIEHLIMDYHETFIAAIGAIKVNEDNSRTHKINIHKAQALRALQGLYQYGICARVFPHANGDKQRHETIKDLIKRNSQEITTDELQEASDTLTTWFETTGFYSLKKDNDREIITPDFFEKLFEKAGL